MIVLHTQRGSGLGLVMHRIPAIDRGAFKDYLSAREGRRGPCERLLQSVLHAILLVLKPAGQHTG